MLRATTTSIKHLTKHLYYKQSELEQRKPTPIQKNVQKQGIMAKKFLQSKYKLINSSPTDSIDQIHANFINIKKFVNRPHFYIPNKKQYLLNLDKAYDEVIKVHEDYNIFQIGKPRGPLTKNQLVAYQLQKIQKAQKYQLMQTYQFSALILLFIITMEIVIEQYEGAGQKRMSISRQFQLGKKFDDFTQGIKRRFNQKLFELGGQKQRQQVLKDFAKMGIIVTVDQLKGVKPVQKK